MGTIRSQITKKGNLNRNILESFFLLLFSDDLKPRATQIDIGKESAIEAEVRAARERAVVPLETRIKSFREMLAEKEVCSMKEKYPTIS